MKKLAALLGIAVLMLSASTVFAKNPKHPADYHGLDHPGMASQLYLYEKDSNWDIVSDGAWGKMTFKDDFVFNGHDLVADTEYTLINYGGWSDVICMGDGVSDEYGNIHIMGEMPDPLLEEENGAKIWLVTSASVDCASGDMTLWAPADFLFEYNTL